MPPAPPTSFAPAACWRRTAPISATLGSHAAVGDLLRGRLASLGTKQRCIGITLKGGAAAWERLIGLAASGAIAPTITRSIRLEEVAAAQAAMATGHSRGKTIVVPSR